jgi:hypothetical protein
LEIYRGHRPSEPTEPHFAAPVTAHVAFTRFAKGIPMAVASQARRCCAGIVACFLTATCLGCGSGGHTNPAAASDSPVIDGSNGTPEPSGQRPPTPHLFTWNIAPGVSSALTGKLDTTDQINVYSIGSVAPGDRITVEVFGEQAFNPAVIVMDAGENVMVANDDRAFRAGITDSLAAVTVQEASPDCLIAVSTSPAVPTTGPYTLQVYLEEGDQPLLPESQRVYFNFNGAVDVRIGSRLPVDVPPFDAADMDAAFAADSAEIAYLTLQRARQDYVGLEVEFYSSLDGPPPEAPYTTIHFGAFDPDLLGIAENVDEYNHDKEQQAIVFVDTFAAFAAINPTVEQIAQALANVASHEAGHLMGLYHTQDPNGIMDITASLRQLAADQHFARSPLHDEVFHIGYQDALATLVRNVGGNLEVSRQAALDQEALRELVVEPVDEPPARTLHVFGTCDRCVNAKSTQLQRIRMRD